MAHNRSWLLRRLLLVPFGVVAVGGVVWAASGGGGVAGVAHVVGISPVVAVAAEPWYDPTPLLVSLRPEVRAGLADALRVTHLEDVPLYDLDLSYDPSAPSFTLGEEVWFTNTTAAPLSDLVFRVYANASPPDGGPQVRFVSGSCLGQARCGFGMASPSAIRVTLLDPLAPGGRVHLKMALTGLLTRIAPGRTDMVSQGLEGLRSVFGGGAGGTDYGLLAVGDGIASFANFYAVLARRSDSGGWEADEVSKLGDLGSDRVANVRARLELPSGARLAVVGVVTGERPVKAEPGASPRREVNVAAAAIRDFAFVTGEALEVATREVHGVPVRSYYRAADRAEGGKVLDFAARALEDFERRFGPYPYADYDVAEAAIVGGAGGVEFSGMVTAASMFYRPMTAPSAHLPPGAADGLAGILGQLGTMGQGGMTSGMLEFVVAHETAHQWWHGLVGSDSRDHPFVDEALAQYSAMLYLEDRYGRARAEKDGNANVKMNYQTMRMLGKPDTPADQPVAAYGSNIAYAGVVYGKAPYFYKAAREAVGDVAFFTGLRQYVSRYRFSEAPARGLADILAAGAEAKIRPLERRWLDETHGDEDLGTLDLAGLLGGGAGAAGGLGDMDQVMKALEQAAGAMGGGAMGGGAVGSGGMPAPGEINLDDLLKALQHAQ